MCNGNHRPLDLTGKKFNMLTVTGRGNRMCGRATWRCTCDCGRVTDVITDKLKSGHTKSCGCLNLEKWGIGSGNLTQDALKNVLEYDADTGKFSWKVRVAKHVTVGDEPGGIDSMGYWSINLGGKHQKAHRLAWLYTYGYFPDTHIDHINRVKTDNRIVNLRLATVSQNAMNKDKQRNNTSGHKGVYLAKKSQKWVAQCTVNKVTKHIGTYSDLGEAKAAYVEYAKVAHGEFNPFEDGVCVMG